MRIVCLRPIVFISIALIAATVAAACTTGDDEPDPTATPRATEPAGRTAPTATVTLETDPGSPTPEVSPTSTTAGQTAEPTVTPTTREEPTPSPAMTSTPQEEATPSPEAPTPTSGPVDLAAISLSLEEVAGGFEEPTGISVANDGSGRLFIVEKGGRIRIVQNGEVAPEPFLDLTDRVSSEGSEQGLLGLAFHPDYSENGTFYVNYTNTDGDTVISRFQVTDDPNRADAGSETPILTLDQPASNHNGGNLVFGPDGHLYIGMGDGGGGGDTYGNAQNGSTLLGAMLRIDPSTGGNQSGEPYTIPPDNPFVDNPDVRDEIWAIGLRNPWRYSFDARTGDLYIGDVGQNRFEEVDFQPAGVGGQNYGWPILEGVECFESESCNTEGFTMPVFTYPLEEDNCAVTAGYVYRGQDFPGMQGVFLLGDYCSGKIWGMQRTDQGWEAQMLTDTELSISSFGQSEARELFLVDLRGGGLYRITAG